jgi:2-polyprenyl-3-methyl-5-hydroxy-6-metoxy-1,4-benzoquinol methylase
VKGILARYSDNWLERYDEVTGDDATILQAELNVVDGWFDRCMPDLAGCPAQHLDLGTCTGRYLRWGLSRGFSKVHGLDKSAAAVARCRARLASSPVDVHHADFLDAATMAELETRHGSFDLVTMMMGTINHLAWDQQHQVIRNLVPVLAPSSHLVISSWRLGACALSLYSRMEQHALGVAGFAPGLDGDRIQVLGLRMNARLFTDWHEIRVYERR